MTAQYDNVIATIRAAWRADPTLHPSWHSPTVYIGDWVVSAFNAGRNSSNTLAAVGALKDHEIARLINDLRDVAIAYRDAQQLRERIAMLIRPLRMNYPL